MTRCARRGVTLIELLVVLAILGVVAGIAGLALRQTPPIHATDSVSARIAELRRVAIEGGRAVTVSVYVHGRLASATAQPDGSVIADEAIPIDRFTGEAPRDSL
jgi:prepilin-type N-terminal cleavage/methylation domain-containing protein